MEDNLDAGGVFCWADAGAKYCAPTLWGLNMDWRMDWKVGWEIG